MRQEVGPVTIEVLSGEVANGYSEAIVSELAQPAREVESRTPEQLGAWIHEQVDDFSVLAAKRCAH